MGTQLGQTLRRNNGRPGIWTYIIVGVLRLRRIFDENNESFLVRRVENSYWQYFLGELYFQHKAHFDRTE
jgi:transposase, IS5 family